MPITLRDRKRIRDLFALLGSPHAGESETAKAKLDELLQKLRLTWNDLPGLLGSSDDSAADANGSDEDDPPAGPSAGIPSALDLVHHMLREFVDLRSRAEDVAVALWILHTHVFGRFLVTPRLALVSPVRGCGKTTLLELLEHLAARTLRTDGISPAALYHLIDTERRTLLIDEADNADLAHNGQLRAVLNSGHRKGGGITRLVNGKPKRFSTFGPVAIAAIGSLPLPIMARSVVVHMQRTDGARKLRHINDVHATADLDLAYRHVFMWSRTAKLDPNPDMPTGLRNRAADNWRPLLAIADSFGPHWGAAARDAAIALCHGDTDEDIGVMLLSDIRDVFDDLGLDRIFSAELTRF